ncbi:MAG: hypothetical protein KA020_06890, partial [Planctomycetes bacterium]|nr:hypothetical protein [Planctomycetota bacterium]
NNDKHARRQHEETTGADQGSMKQFAFFTACTHFFASSWHLLAVRAPHAPRLIKPSHTFGGMLGSMPTVVCQLAPLPMSVAV